MTIALRLAGLAALLALCLAGCGGGGGGGTPSTAPVTPATEGVTTMFSLESRQSGVVYPIWVYAPADAATGAPPPVIYLLDAESRFGILLLELQRAGVRATLVGVGYTSVERRQTDFLEPGADAYYHFLVDEVFPLVESRYRVDPARRVFSGHSSGGLFAMYALFRETPANHRFAAIIAADGSYWQQPANVAGEEAAMYTADSGHALPITVVMGGDQKGNLVYMDPLYQMIVSRHYPGLSISEHEYSLGHVEMDAPFFAESLHIIFPTGR